MTLALEMIIELEPMSNCQMFHNEYGFSYQMGVQVWVLCYLVSYLYIIFYL